MNLVRILLLVFLVYAALKQKSEESRNVILIVTGLLAVCMMNKEGYLVNCDEADPGSNFGRTSSAPGSCTGKLLTTCAGGQVRNAVTGNCQAAAPPCAPPPECPEGEVCKPSGDCVATGDSGKDTCGDWDNWEWPPFIFSEKGAVCSEGNAWDTYCKSSAPSSDEV
tara:strand:- start:76 stop:573 length:498 start_codon:yes stop_codon:yes gene_type:complete